jgi:Flp pilus assembly protein TadG
MQAAVQRPRVPGMARGRRGQSLVEMAVAFPLLLLLVAGALDLAHAYSLAGILANAAREGARHGASHATDADIKTRVVQEAAGAPLALDPNKVTITRDPPGDDSAGSSITVEVTYDVDLLLSQALGLSQPTIRRHATMVIF